MQESGPELDYGLPEGRAELVAMLRERGSNDMVFRDALAEWLDQIPEEENGDYRTTVFRSLAGTEVLLEAGYWQVALVILAELLNELHGVQHVMPHVYIDLIDKVNTRYQALKARVEALENGPTH